MAKIWNLFSKIIFKNISFTVVVGTTGAGAGGGSGESRIFVDGSYNCLINNLINKI